MTNSDMKVDTATEWRPRDRSEPLRQGDIFAWKADTSYDPWRRFGVLVTADCDFARSKHRDILTYCPILRFNDFLSTFWLPADTGKAIDKLAKSVSDRLTPARRQYRPQFDAPVNPSLLPAWLRRRGVSGVLDDIGIPEGERGSLSEPLQILLELLMSITAADTRVRLMALAKARLLTPSPSEEKMDKMLASIWKDYEDRIHSLPGDLFFLNALSPNEQVGYVVYLRRLGEIAPNAIATRPIEEGARGAVRISRLGTPYRYRLTQKPAAVFADIGLPTDYEQRSQQTIRAIGESLQLNL